MVASQLPTSPKMTNPPHIFLALLLAPSIASAQDLLVDFNSTTQGGGPTNQAGYQAFDAAHENNADFSSARSYSAFGNHHFAHHHLPRLDRQPHQADDRSRCRQRLELDRPKIDLITDWIGVDTRTGNGGNGNFDGATGNPTRLILTLSGLPAASYNWRSYHHDTEHMFGDFQIEISTTTATHSPPPKRSPAPIPPPVATPTPAPPARRAPATRTTRHPPLHHRSRLHRHPANPSSSTSPRFPRPPSIPSSLVLNGFEITSTAPAHRPHRHRPLRQLVLQNANVGTTVGSLSSTDPTPDDTSPTPSSPAPAAQATPSSTSPDQTSSPTSTSQPTPAAPSTLSASSPPTPSAPPCKNHSPSPSKATPMTMASTTTGNSPTSPTSPPPPAPAK